MSSRSHAILRPLPAMARRHVLPGRAVATHPGLRARSGCDTSQNRRILRRERMAKIKHIALTTHDLEQVASFYKNVFGMTEVGRGGSTHIYLSDGDLNLTIRACKKSDDPDVGEQGENFSGIHHIGFVVDNVPECADRMEQAGATRLTPRASVERRGEAG